MVLSQVTLGGFLNLSLVICETERLMVQIFQGLGGLDVIICAKCLMPAVEEIFYMSPQFPSALPLQALQFHSFCTGCLTLTFLKTAFI